MGALVRLLWHSWIRPPLPKRERFDLISQTSLQISSTFYVVLANHTEEAFVHHIFWESVTEHPKNNKKRKSILLFRFFFPTVHTKLRHLSSHCYYDILLQTKGLETTEAYYITVVQKYYVGFTGFTPKLCWECIGFWKKLQEEIISLAFVVVYSSASRRLSHSKVHEPLTSSSELARSDQDSITCQAVSFPFHPPCLWTLVVHWSCPIVWNVPYF